mgnify:CR=1 FL=1
MKINNINGAKELIWRLRTTSEKTVQTSWCQSKDENNTDGYATAEKLLGPGVWRSYLCPNSSVECQHCVLSVITDEYPPCLCGENRLAFMNIRKAQDAMTLLSGFRDAANLLLRAIAIVIIRDR